MKVLMVNKFLYPNGGSETYIFKLGNYLKTHGHEVQYFGMEHENRCVGNSAGAYTRRMDFHGKMHLSKLIYPLETIYSIDARLKIRKVLEKFRPDVVHLNNFNYQITPSIILEIVKWRKQEKYNCKIVYTAHDYQLVCPNHMLRNPIDCENCEKCLAGHFGNCIKGRCIHGSLTKSIIGSMEAIYWNLRGTYGYIDTIICPSDYVKSKLDTNPIFANKTITVHNFIDIPEFKAKENHEKYVLYFGRLSEEKGINTLKQACERLQSVKFVFLGDGPLVESLKGISNIVLKGFKQGDELWNAISQAEFCIVPSEWNEVFGLTIGEAVKLGTPVIASDIGGIPESLKGGGVLFSPGNVTELTNLISKLWNNENLLRKLRKECKSIQFITCEEYGENIISIYS